MNPERYAQIKETFAHARELGAEERGEYLDQACERDAELRTEVEELLEADLEHSDDAFDRALSDDEELQANRALPRPRQIGKYRILSVCGSGGMGTVYEAEQDTPLRRVALKVIQSSAPRPDLLRRFRRETAILARLQHPCIAQIFDAGEFEQDGVLRPFFAMEFIDGAPLLQFATRHALDVSARLEIFTRICDAIQYAHQQGVVHRDLKPDNIFVVETSSSGSTTSPPSAIAGQPKILDFGVASLTDPEAQITMATEAGQLLGSVPYMSPEQATGLPDEIDARSDVYALGVVLFELLTGKLPYDVKQRAIADALHSIRYGEPSRLGSADPGLGGDLETIVGKCLEKDKDRRYPSVGALVDDLRRYQELKPIAARPPTTWYQLKKFTQRNRALVGGAVTTALALVGGAILAVLFAVDAREAQVRSDRSAYRANLGAASALLDSDPAHARRILDETPEERRGWEWRMLSSSLSGFLLEFGEVVRRKSNRFRNIPGEDMHVFANGEEVIALSADDEFRIWRTWTGEVVRTLQAPEEVGVFAASREGNLLAAALVGGRVVVCDPRLDEPVWTTWFESDTLVDTLAVAPAGDLIAIDRPTEVRFGAPDAWHVVETGKRTFYTPPALEFSLDGTQLAGLFENAILFDVATGEPIGEPMTSVQIHWALAMAPDQQHFAIGQMRRELRIFDAMNGEMMFDLLGHNASISDVAYGNGNRLLSSSQGDGTIRVWDLERREQIAIFDAPKTTRAEFIGEDHILSLTDGRFRLWTLQNRRARELVGNAGLVFGTVFSGDGELLASSSPWGDLLVWDVLEGTPLFREAAGGRDHFAFDPSGERLFSGLAGEAFRLGFVPTSERAWTGGTGIPPDGPKRPLLNHSQHQESGELRVQGTAARFELEGLQVFRTEHGRQPSGGQVRAFVDGEELALPLPHVAPKIGPHPQLFLGPDWFAGSIAELIVIAGGLSARDANAIDAYLTARGTGSAGANANFPALDGVLAHFRADENTVERHEGGFVKNWTAMNDADLVLGARGGPRRTTFVPATEDRPAYVQFEIGYGSAHWMETPLPEASSAEPITVCWLGGYEAGRTFPGNARRTAYSIESLDVRWTERDDRILKTGAGVALSANGRYGARTIPPPRQGGSVTVSELRTGHTVAHFDGGDYHYFGVSFHPDGRRLACATVDGAIDVFDVETHELVQRIEAHSGSCWDVAYSPDGKLLASAGNDNTLRLWDAETYEPLLELPGHRSYVRCINWSSDGSMLVSGSGDRIVRIWDAVPRSERYAQLLANRALERDVTSFVLEVHATLGGARVAIAEKIKSNFEGDAARRRAALKVLARMK